MTRLFILNLLFFACAATACATEATDVSADLWSKPPLFPGMGNNSMPIATQNQLAQKYFDQGLVLYYGFNFPESARSFREASRLDPQCAACLWGEALALGDCIDRPGDHWCVATCQALERARNLLPARTNKFTDLIQALSLRYKKTSTGYVINHDDYIMRMKELTEKYPNDPDSIAVYVKGHMDHVDMKKEMKNGKPFGETKEILDALERGLALDPMHPGLLHLKIHALENSGLSEQGLGAADALSDLVPGSGHLQHMPAHIYFHVGRYHDATTANLLGIEADEKLFARGGIKAPEFAGFYLHNFYFIFDCLVMEGRSQESLETAKKVVSQLKSGEYPSDIRLRNIFFSVPYLVMARFGNWEEIRKQTPPPSELLYATGTWHYANGLADLNSGKLDAAKRQLAELDKVQRRYEKNKPHEPMVDLLILSKMDLSAQIAGAEGDTDRQIQILSEAIAVEDGIYLHMLPWYFPLRLAIGEALLNAGDPHTAEQVFRDELTRHPQSGWALYGLAQALQAQGKTVEAQKVQQQFQVAWQYADVPLSGARF